MIQTNKNNNWEQTKTDSTLKKSEILQFGGPQFATKLATTDFRVVSTTHNFQAFQFSLQKRRFIQWHHCYITTYQVFIVCTAHVRTYECQHTHTYSTSCQFNCAHIATCTHKVTTSSRTKPVLKKAYTMLYYGLILPLYGLVNTDK